MLWALRASATRLRLIAGRLLTRLGLGDESFLVVLAFLVGAVTAAAAVGFHELIIAVRNFCYVDSETRFDLYGRHLWMIVMIPAAGGLLVGIIARWVHRRGEGASVVDVMESVGRSSTGVRPTNAIEKIVTSAVTIGTGGSAGAEGPIVTIGAAIASGVGQLFGVARQHMPVLTGCGTAAGISAIFNAPIGGVLFTLEVILQDFSIRTFTPVVLASVIANVTTQEIFRVVHPDHAYQSIFRMPAGGLLVGDFRWASVPTFLLLGVLCGAIGVILTRLMYFAERKFAALPITPVMKPAIGGAMLGAIGALYIMIFGWFLLGGQKPIDVQHYPMPAFFGDGYGVVRQMISGELFKYFTPGVMTSMLAFFLVAKIFGTCLTLGSGGSGGIIAPSLFLGATGGALLGHGLQRFTFFAGVEPHVCALIGMGAVLAAVVHAPLAAILILFEVTGDRRVMLPAMLACVIATAVARLLFADSIYTLGLRLRGVHTGSAADTSVLRRLTVEQVGLEPATILHADDPFQRVLDLTTETGATTFVVVDRAGSYSGMIVTDDIRAVLLEREAIPLLLVGEMMRTDVPFVRNTDDLATVFDTFGRHDVSHLPVCIANSPGRVIGLISRAALMRRYQKGLAESR